MIYFDVIVRFLRTDATNCLTHKGDIILEIRQLRYFLSVAATEHLTQSAQALFITQSTLSHGLRELESELGLQLFERLGRGLRLSQAGHIFKSYAGRALQELEAGRMQLTRLNALQTGRLTVGVIPSFLNSIVPKAVERFSALYPGVTISIRDLRADPIEALLLSGELDVGIAFHPTERKEIEAEHLFSEELQLLVGPGHALAKKRSVPMKALDNLPICLLPKSFATRLMLDELFAASRVSPSIRVEMDSVGALIAACASGVLATIVPERSAQMHPAMCAIAFTRPKPLRHAGILWRRNASRSPAALAFVSLVKEGERAVLNHSKRR
jgi:LysR family transcriptional regulator, cyn operon transcriptional activator